jgi:Zn-dependent peptidase ImmA (M78 family)
MLIPISQIKSSLDIAQEVLSLFATHTRQNGDLDVSIDDFRKFIQTYAVVSVQFHRIPHAGEPIRGACIIYDDHYDIVLLAGQDPYWTRFVEFKEHFHVILDTYDAARIFRNPNFVSQVENTFAAFPDVVNKTQPPVSCEKLAEIAAMEFLMPYSRRGAMSKCLVDGTATLSQYENLYKLPSEIIDLYLSPSYIENLGNAGKFKA